jgi:acyl homoserine lactone synthase
MIRITRGYDLAVPLDAAMFEARRALFVDLMRWTLPVRFGRFEIDQFDGPHATYLVASDPGGGHSGSMRLLPSARPHILGDLFAALCDDPVPCGADTCEITRLCLPAGLGAARRLEVRNRLISAMVDHALAEGIRTLTGVVRPAFRDAVLAMGWEAAPLGPVRVIDGLALGAFRIGIAPETPARLARTGIYAPYDRVPAPPAAVAA